MKIWGHTTGVIGERQAYKCYIDGQDEPIVFLLPKQKSIKKFSKKLAKRLGQYYHLEIEDYEGDRHQLNSDDDLEVGRLLVENDTFRLYLSNPRSKHLELLNAIPVPYMIIDYFGTIIHSNEELIGFCSLVNSDQVIGRKASNLLNGLPDYRNSLNWNKKTEVLLNPTGNTLEKSALVIIRPIKSGLFVINLFDIQHPSNYTSSTNKKSFKITSK